MGNPGEGRERPAVCPQCGAELKKDKPCRNGCDTATAKPAGEPMDEFGCYRAYSGPGQYD